MIVIGKQVINGKRITTIRKTFTSYDVANTEPFPCEQYHAFADNITAAIKAAALAHNRQTAGFLS